MVTKMDVGDYDSSNTCSHCDEESVATLRIGGEYMCLSCISGKFQEGRYSWQLYNYDELTCSDCGDRIEDGEEIYCYSCGDTSEMHSSDDCHDDCEVPARDFTCSSCDNQLGDDADNGKALHLHEKCYEEVRTTAESLVAAEPEDTYEVTW